MTKSLVKNYQTFAAAEASVKKMGYTENKGGNPITGVRFNYRNKDGRISKTAIIFRAKESMYKALLYSIPK